eukprot:TRINITY_DN577_c0_g1_i1.p2 TRINITY_DN577_c0_g1~~TRINITY_DN577_c0_g1_i1.p2  ORF type:complete len:325 (+),score=91.72 TRINITY_DN577_c0_g1_i1:1333-2307(+)
MSLLEKIANIITDAEKQRNLRQAARQAKEFPTLGNFTETTGSRVPYRDLITGHSRLRGPNHSFPELRSRGGPPSGRPRGNRNQGNRGRNQGNRSRNQGNRGRNQGNRSRNQGNRGRNQGNRGRGRGNPSAEQFPSLPGSNTTSDEKPIWAARSNRGRGKKPNKRIAPNVQQPRRKNNPRKPTQNTVPPPSVNSPSPLGGTPVLETKKTRVRNEPSNLPGAGRGGMKKANENVQRRKPNRKKQQPRQPAPVRRSLTNDNPFPTLGSGGSQSTAAPRWKGREDANQRSRATNYNNTTPAPQTGDQFPSLPGAAPINRSKPKWNVRR